MHPDWTQSWKKSTGQYDADIAILKFDTIQYSSYVNKICLPSIGEDVFSLHGTIVGYGFSSLDKNVAEDIPRFAEIGSVSQIKCLYSDSRFVEIASERSFCAGDAGKIACKGLEIISNKFATKVYFLGDSGGGFILKDPVTKRWRILGIISSAIITLGECDPNKYSVFTNVVSFLDWIKSNGDLD
jgi:hypothetical protein